MRSLTQLLLTLLLNAAWQVAVVTLLAACANWLLRETAAWCRHSVWVAAIMISLVLPIISGLNTFTSSPIPNQGINRVQLEPNAIRPMKLAVIDPAERMSVTAQPVPYVEPVRERSLPSPVS